MKKIIFLVVMAGGFACGPIRADDPTVPAASFNADHYATLWTKSPFAVATAEAVADSPDYSLVGVTQLEGVSYASIIEKQNQDHFLISSDKANKGLTLKNITRSHGTSGLDTFATVEKDGQILTLKLEALPAGVPAAGAPGIPAMPGAAPGVPPVTQNITFPTATQVNGTQNPSYASTRFIRVHRPVVHLPPQPNENPAEGQNAPVQDHTPPPPAAVPAQ